MRIRRLPRRKHPRRHLADMDVLSCGAGMQSTALALMSCEKKMLMEINPLIDPYPDIPIYGAIIFCDLGYEPPWVYKQVAFIARACKKAGIYFKVLDTHMYEDYINDFGFKELRSIPFWTIGPDGVKSKLRRRCTIHYKIEQIQKFVRWNLLGYKKGQRTRPEDIGAHTMHIGFSKEEMQRCFESQNPLFVNKYPLVDMNLERADNYAYARDIWGLETKASACCICPFHRNYFFQYMKDNHLEEYDAILRMDYILEYRQPLTPIKSRIFISRSRKRVWELTEEDCSDAEYFFYRNQPVWNGF